MDQGKHHTTHTPNILLSKALSGFFESKSRRENLLIDNYFVIDVHGNVLHSHCTLCDVVTLGALLCAMMAAQKALMAHCFPHTIAENILGHFHCPIGLGNSKEGLFIYPIYFQNDVIFLGHQYKEILNPGYIRYQLHSMALEIEDYFHKNYPNTASSTPIDEEETSALFPKLTQEEIDALFLPSARENNSVHG